MSYYLIHRAFTIILATAVFLAVSGPSIQAADQMAKANPQMQEVLDALAELQAKPIHTLDVPHARTQASTADAAATVQRDKKISPYPEIKVATKDISIPTANGNLPARVYSPDGKGPFPLIVYFHGGGWVIGDLNVYDATPRSLVLGSKAIVVSVDYHHAPENKFPAQHEDAWNAYVWIVEHGHTLNGDTKRIAVAGESAGGNLAANVALMAKKMKTVMPVHELLVYPVAGNDMATPSYIENADAKPLGKKEMEWFVNKVFKSKAEINDPRLNLVGRDDLAGLPPTTLITAQIDPLRSEGETLAEKMKSAGVAVNLINVQGVTHEFFSMGKVVDAAKKTMESANADLTKSFSKP